jgi:uncharacterized membrane protein YbhN (UPF0104 family)
LSPKARTWLSRLVKLAVCAGALWYLSGKVTIKDRVRLRDEPSVAYILESEADGTLGLRHPATGEPRNATTADLAARDQLPEGVRPRELGMQSIVSQTDAQWALWALLALAPVTFSMAWRLQLLLDTQEIALPYRDSLLLTFAGNFFNFAMPGTTGGDLYKAYHIARRTHKRTEGVTVVLLDRVIGLISFLILAAATIFASWKTDLIGVYGRWVGYMMLALIVAGAMFFSQRFRRWIRYDALIRRLPLADKIERIDKTALSFRYHQRDAIMSLAVTLFSHLLIVVCVYALARGLGIHPTGGRSAWDLFQACLLATTVGYLFAAIPVSVQGFGLLELIFEKVLVKGHWCSASQMLALTLGIRLIQIIWSLPGVIVPWLGFERPKQDSEG